MWHLRYLVMLSTMSSWGALPTPLHTASALPHNKPFCPCNEAILDTIQPFCTGKMYSAETQICEGNESVKHKWHI